MKSILAISIYVLAQLAVLSSFAQKKLAVLGSSTAYGNGASVGDSSWVGRLRSSFTKNMSDGVDTVIDNRAVPGYVTYQSLPTGYPVPPNRPSPDPSANITYVLNSVPKPDVVIINYPTNDIVNGYDPKEMMDNLRLMFQQLNANNIRCFITTTQPRNTATDAQRTILRQLVDSIQMNFGIYSINFWDDLVTNDGLNRLKPEVDADGTHPNDLGHRFLFQRVQAKNIFSNIGGAPLPLSLKNWGALLENNHVNLNWNTAHEELNTLFEVQRSPDGKDFQTLYRTSGTGHDATYSWTDASPLTGKSFYRLKITEAVKTSYSRVVPVINNEKQLIWSFYADAAQLHVQLNSRYSQSAVLTIVNLSGAVIKKQSFRLNSPNTGITIPISELLAGNYFLKITTTEGLTAVERFAKLK